MKENPVIPSLFTPDSEDIQALTETSRDYIGGWFTADEQRVQRYMRPQLVKRTFWRAEP